jgi:ketosteroid isomerase-like protein
VPENAEIVRGIYRAWERGDFSSIDWADPEIEFDIPGPSETANGISEMSRVWGGFLEAYSDLRLQATEYFERGDVVVTRQLFQGKGRASGIPVDDIMGGCTFTLRDGKVVRFQGYTNLDDALADAGISRDET